jgi:hypothetical protein
MKEQDIVLFKNDFEFEAIDENDNPIGMRTIPKGTKATVVSDSTRRWIIGPGLSTGWVTLNFDEENWKGEWGINDVLDIPVENLESIT